MGTTKRRAFIVVMTVALTATGPAWAQGRLPGAASDASIATLQTEVVTAEYQEDIATDQRQLAADENQLATAQGTLSRDQAAASTAAATAASEAAQVTTDTQQLAAAQAEQVTSAAAVVTDRSTLADVAIELYAGAAPAPTTTNNESLATVQQKTFESELVTVSTEVIEDQLAADEADEARAVTDITTDTASLATDQKAEAQAQTLADDSATILGRDQAAVGSSEQSVDDDQATLAGDEADLSSAAATVVGSDSSTPTILGPSALTAAQLTAWYDNSGYGDFTSTPIGQLASWYVSEGDAEGVRGDIAFAQAIVETGGFSSPDAININNYAGIGHCDSCDTGLPFASAQIGVDAQIQLLRTTADPTLTTAELGQPLASSELAPQDQPLRGCCSTWIALAGKWATDPEYGTTILSVYADMLDYALG